MASDSYVAKAGAAATASVAAWARQSATRSNIDWLPRPNSPVLMPDGTFTPIWYRYFAEIARRLDGILGRSVAELGDSVSMVQTSVLDVSTAAAAAQSQAAAAAASIDVIREVAINNGLSGAENIP